MNTTSTFPLVVVLLVYLLGTNIESIESFVYGIKDDKLGNMLQSDSQHHYHLMQSITTDSKNRTLGTIQSCPAGNTFNVSYLSASTVNPSMNVTISASGSCLQANGTSALGYQKYQGGLSIVNQQNGNNITAPCVYQILFNPSLVDQVPLNSDQNSYALTTCSSSMNGTSMIRTKAPYTLSNGTVIPAGSLPSEDLYYLVWVGFHQSRNSTVPGQLSTFVIILDLGWWDTKLDNATSIPDPVNNMRYLQNCLQAQCGCPVGSPIVGWDIICNKQECLQAYGPAACSGDPSLTCGMNQCPANK